MELKHHHSFDLQSLYVQIINYIEFRKGLETGIVVMY